MSRRQTRTSCIILAFKGGRKNRADRHARLVFPIRRIWSQDVHGLRDCLPSESSQLVILLDPRRECADMPRQADNLSVLLVPNLETLRSPLFPPVRQTSRPSDSSTRQCAVATRISKRSEISSSANLRGSRSRRSRARSLAAASPRRSSNSGAKGWSGSCKSSPVILCYRRVESLTSICRFRALSSDRVRIAFQTGSKVLCPFLQDPSWSPSHY